MPVTVAPTLNHACSALAERPEAPMLAGGTDLMVEVNHGRRHLVDVVTLYQIPELSHWERIGAVFRLG